jgi:hypothetical protein
MRRILFVLALLTALVPISGNPVSAQVAPLAPFSGYSTGTAVHVGALEALPTRILDTEIAFSGANVNSEGLSAALSNELAQAYQGAAPAGTKSAARGSGVEIGVGTTVPNITNANQINPGSTIEAFAPVSTDLLQAQIGPVNLSPIINATLARGQAQAIYNNSVCVLGQPISSGLGFVGNADLVNTGTAALLATNTGANAVHQSRSHTYLIPNGDGTYGLVSESRQILAPITVFPGVSGLGVITVEFAGEWVLRSTATGKPGGSTVDYAPVGSNTPTTKVITVKVDGTELASVTTQQILDKDGLVVTLPASLGVISIGAPPRAIAGTPTSVPELAANGTKAAAAVDVVQLTASLASQALGLVDLRVGHMESMATVPVGGIKCGIPVTKTGSPTTVTAGDAQTVTYTITVPSDPEAFKVIACDIVNLKVEDVITTDNPLVKFTILSASAPGVISGGNKVTWDLGTYKPGDPAKVLTVTMDVPADSAAGKITDVATATAVLGNCKGNASANATSLTGLAKLDAAAITGNASLVVPGTTVLAGQVVAAPGPTPIGGVQTGAGGTSGGSGRLLPIGMALGSIALVASLVAQRRRQHS